MSAENQPSHTLLLDIYDRLAIVEAQNAQITRSQIEAVDSRREINKKLEKLAPIAAAVEEMKPIVKELEGLRQRAIGASIVGKLFWVLIGSLLTGIGIAVDYLTRHSSH